MGETAESKIFSQIRSVVDRLQALDAEGRGQGASRLVAVVIDGEVRGELETPVSWEKEVGWKLTITAKAKTDHAEAS